MKILLVYKGVFAQSDDVVAAVVRLAHGQLHDIGHCFLIHEGFLDYVLDLSYLRG